MQSGQFPKSTFAEALTVTKKIKGAMKPFMEQFSLNNMPWVFEAIAILFHNLTHPSVEPLIKMNSMFAIKCIVDSCEYVPIALIETYILPIIRIGAFTELDEKDDRGCRFFGQNQEELAGYGFNYVLLCTELVRVLAVIKPKALHYNEETKDSSEFQRANVQLTKQLKHPPDALKFFKEKPEDLHALYLKNINKFNENPNNYDEFVRKTLQKQLKAGFVNKGPSLDVRELVKAGDLYINDDCLALVGQFLESDKFPSSTYLEGIKFLSENVRAGNANIAYFMHDNSTIKNLVQEVIKIPGQSKGLDRGVNFMPKLSGTPEEKKQLYQEFLRSLEFWSESFLKDSLKPSTQPSNISKYHKILKNNYKFQFPTNPLLSNYLKDTELNCKRRKDRNDIIKEQIQQANEIGPETENSVIINAVSTKSIKKAEEPPKKPEETQKKNEHLQGKPQSNSKIAATPAGGKDQTEQCFQKCRQAMTTIDLLTKNERDLPKNMKTIQDILSHVSHYLEHNELPDEVSFSLVEKSVEIDDKLEKIRPAYEDYKKNKIDYKKFCQLVLPPPSKSRIEESSGNIKQKNRSESEIKEPEFILKQDSRKDLQPVPKKEQKMESQPKIQIKQPQIKPPPITQPNFILKQSKKEIKIDSVPRIQHSNIHQSPIQQKVNFNQSSMQESRMTQKRSVHGNGESYEPVTYVLNPHPHNYNGIPQASPIKGIMNQSHYSYDNYTMPPKLDEEGIKEESENRSVHNLIKEMGEQQRQFIQNPMLNPLDHSYHDVEEVYNESLQTKSFKEAINNQKLFIKTNKKENLFKMGEECASLIKPVQASSRKSSRVESKINVPELLNERSKKYQIEMKILQENKDREIKELRSKLNYVEREKSSISEELRAKEDEIRSLRQNSEAGPVKSRANLDARSDHFSLVDDQQYLMKKKLGTANSAYNMKRLGESLKGQSRILAKGELIDSKYFNDCLAFIDDQKTKKIFMKNKELLYKENDRIQIGYIGQLKDQVYSVTIFITPERDFVLNDFEIAHANSVHQGNLQIEHDLERGLSIGAKKQSKRTFLIRVKGIPYQIPLVRLRYSLDNQNLRADFYLPCAFHKFLPITRLRDEVQFNRAFQSGSVMRGEQIPYSRKILKNIDLLHDFLTDIQKLNRGQPNQKGQTCFGGLVNHSSAKFFIKVSVKPNQFLYLQAISLNGEQSHRAIAFYIATVNYFLMKDVNWN